MRKIGNFTLGLVLGSFVSYQIVKYFEPPKKQKTDKFKSYYNMLTRWLELEDNNLAIDKLFKQYGYNKIAIYGMGKIGMRLCNQLRNTDIEIAYVIDQYAKNVLDNICFKDPQDKLDEVDAVIVTIPFAYFEIKNQLTMKLECPIVSLEHILFEV
ncbi:MAG: hypothetical protein K0S47_4261 [Herbinix sp.]|jgi:hypothetical protein|nr:hypothetical protein [Herbinix sp.]